MATSDQRSGFRLPWNSDRSHDQPPADEPADEPVAEGDGSETTSAEEENVVWPESELNARLGLTSQPRPPEPPANDLKATATDPEELPMSDQDAAPVSQRPTTRKPSKLMADLSAAIRATAETAREQALAQVDADVAKVVEEIRGGSKEGEDALRTKSDADIAAIREWSRAEIARIKEQTEGKIDARKTALTAELAAHAGAIDARVAEVEGTAESYRSEIAAYAERLIDEDDPALLATLAESMPEPPSLEALADLGDLAWAVAEPEAFDEDEPETEAVGEAPPEATADAGPEAVTEAVSGQEPADQAPEPEAAGGAPVDAEPAAAIIETPVLARGEAAGDAPGHDAGAGHSDPADGPWGAEGATWRADGATAIATDDVQPWVAGETPVAATATEDGADAVDRGAIMAALEAAAEAVVAAESAAESAGQAEAAADLAETAAKLLTDHVDTDGEVDPEAAAAMSARVDAGGVEESYTDRLAKLLPTHPETAGSTEPRTTQVVVTGLVSVASIASFKRHLGRISGVKSVTVASGPGGEFVFNVTHAPDVSFRDAVPTMPGFAARVTGTADGTVQVSARDPEAEG